MVTLVPSQLSLALGGINAIGCPHSTVTLAAQLRDGGVVSTTTILWLQSELFVQESVARHVRVAVKVLPQKPVVFVTVVRTWIVMFVPSQMSLAVGAVNAKGSPHSTIRLAAQLKAGGVVSTTTMLWLQVEL